jgi:hypothetical protein
MSITKSLCTLIVFMIFSGSLIDFTFAQSDVTTQNNVTAQNDSPKAIDGLDDLLTNSVTATLTGLSLAGATFLGRSTGTEKVETKNHTIQAQKNFIKAFFMFLVCTVSVFVFDFLEIIIKKPSLSLIIPDIIISYGFFGIGLMYLVKSAREIYVMYGR